MTNSGYFLNLINFHILFERLKFRLKLKFDKHSSLFLEVLALVLVWTAHPTAAWLSSSAVYMVPSLQFQDFPSRMLCSLSINCYEWVTYEPKSVIRIVLESSHIVQFTLLCTPAFVSFFHRHVRLLFSGDVQC